MPDDPKVGATADDDGQDNDEASDIAGEIQEELEAERDEKSGKTPNWHKSKRFRKLTGEAKDGRRVISQLKELGITPSQIPQLADALDRLRDYDAAYVQYQREVKAGHVSAEDKGEADAAAKEANALKKRLRELGVVLKEDQEEEREQELSKRDATRHVTAARDLMIESLEASDGFGELEDSEKREQLAELDFKIGRRLKNNPELAKQFREGSLAPIKKLLTELFPKKEATPRKPGENKPFIKRTAPRIPSGPGSGLVQRKPAGDPKSIKEATESMLSDLKAAKGGRTEE